MYPFPCRNPCTFILLLVACLLVPGISAAGANETAPASSGGTIIVMSFPQGASVFLNDEYRGITPVRLENIPPGEYLVNVSKAGSANDSFPVILFEGSTREIGFTLTTVSQTVARPSGNGSVAVDSDPGGASVRIDGNPVGVTRMDGYALIVDPVTAGSHTVTVELSGYPVYSDTVTVMKNQVVKVSADFVSPVTAVSDSPVPAGTRGEPAPLPPVAAAAAVCIAGLAAAFRRS